MGRKLDILNWDSLVVIALICHFGGMSTADAAQLSPQGMTLQGTILNASSLPEESSNVNFTIQILSPGAEACVLYKETQTLNMANSGGAFSFLLGNGTRSGSAFDGTSILAQVFNNSSSTLTSLTCSIGSTYSPGSTDQRKLILSFDDGSGPQTISQALMVESVPYALYADSLQGKAPTDFVQVNNSTAALTQANLESIFASNTAVTQLLSLINGTSAKYVETNATGAAVPSFASAPGSPATGNIWYNSTSNSLQYYNGTATLTLAAGAVSGGTAAAPSLNFTGDTTTGFYDASAGTIGVSASGSNIMSLSSGNIAGSSALTLAAGGTAQNLTLKSSTTGSVNLGTGNGTQVSILDGGASTVDYITLKGAPTNGGTLTNTSPVIASAGSDTNINLTFAPKGTGNTIFSSGNVGIGTTVPGQLLDIHGANGTTPGFKLSHNQLNSNMGQSLDVDAVFLVRSLSNTYYGGAQVLGQSTASNVAGLTLNGLIGSTTPTAAPLTLVGGKNNGASAATDVGASEKILELQKQSGAALLTVLGGGNVGVGTTSPGAKLDVSGHIANSGAAASIGTCGTSPVISGNDMRGIVTLGTGSPTACTVTFAAAYATSPHCVITPYGGNPGAIQWWITASTAALVMNFSASPTASQQFEYHCIQ